MLVHVVILGVVDHGGPLVWSGEGDVDDLDHGLFWRPGHHDDPVRKEDRLLDAVGHHDDGFGRGLVLPKIDELCLEASTGERVERPEWLVQ